MDPKMESKWSQDLKKESPELILDAMKASANKMLQKSHEEVSGTARAGPSRPEPAREPGLGAPIIKGKHKPEPLIKRVRDREGIIRRPLVPEGTVADQFRRRVFFAGVLRVLELSSCSCFRGGVESCSMGALITCFNKI